MTSRPYIIFGLSALLIYISVTALYAQSVENTQNKAQQTKPSEKEIMPSQASSNSDDIATKVAKLEAEVDKLKKKPKDTWDIFQIIASLLIPASIALTGFFVSNVIKQTEIKSAERIAQGEKEVAVINAKVSQAELIHSFLDPLTGEHTYQRKLAIQALLLALPEDGPRLVQILSESDPDSTVQSFAGEKLAALDQQKLIPYIFDSDNKTSDQARDQFLAGSETDTWTLLKLMDLTVRNHDNHHAVINALEILSSFGPYDSNIMKTMFQRMSGHLDRNEKDVQIALDKVLSRFTTKAENDAA